MVGDESDAGRSDSYPGDSGSDLADILRVQRLAFDSDTEAALTNDILHDPSAKPVLSLMASGTDIRSAISCFPERD